MERKGGGMGGMKGKGDEWEGLNGMGSTKGRWEE